MKTGIKNGIKNRFSGENHGIRKPVVSKKIPVFNVRVIFEKKIKMAYATISLVPGLTKKLLQFDLIAGHLILIIFVFYKNINKID